jgi:hypothetical protein
MGLLSLLDAYRNLIYFFSHILFFARALFIFFIIHSKKWAGWLLQSQRRTASYPTAPPRIPACRITALGSSQSLAYVITSAYLQN